MEVRDLIEELKKYGSSYEIMIEEDRKRKEIVRIVPDAILGRLIINLKECEEDYDAKGNKI